MITYHSRESMERASAATARAGRRSTRLSAATFDVEGYIHYHGAAAGAPVRCQQLPLSDPGDGSLRRRRGTGATTQWLRQIAAPMLLVGIRSDWLFPPSELRALAASAVRSGGTPTYAEIDSPHGHDAFLKEWDAARRHAPAISRPSSRRRGRPESGDDRTSDGDAQPECPARVWSALRRSGRIGSLVLVT